MFARTLTALLLCAAPALAAPPEAPMPRAACAQFPLPPHPMWYDSEVCSPEQLQLWHRMHFDSVYNAPGLPRQSARALATAHRVSFSVQRDQANRETEFMKRALESVRFAPPPEVPTPMSYPDWQQLLFGSVPDAPRRSALETYDGVIQRVCGDEFARAAKSRRLRDEFVALQKCAASAPPVSAEPLVCPPCPLPKIEVNPLLGTWYREFPGEVVALTVTPDEMKLRVTWAGENAGWATVTAQYTLTKNGLAYGAFTGGNGSAGFTDKMSVMMQMLMDAPFSFRFRFTSEGLMIHQLQTCRVLGDDDVRYAGLYTRAKDDKVPAPVAKPEPRAYGPPVPPPVAVPSSFVPPPGAPMQAPPPVRPAALETAPAVLPPVLDGPPPMPPKRPNASAPPDGLKFAAEDAFGALLQQSGVLPKPEPEPLPLAPPAKKLAHVGTWHREIGPMTCVVKIDAEHVTFTGYICTEEHGKKIKQGVVMTGDYHLARDGTTLVGLVTGLDVILEGDAGKAADLIDAAEQVSKVQKALVGKPFAFTVRAYGDALMIGDVNVPRAGDSEIDSAHAMIAGRYKSGEPKTAEPKRLPRATGATVPRIPMADADDPRGIQEEWRRFWFDDQPSHLTPERVRGGIY